MSDTTESMDSLQRGIERRQQELHDVAEAIARAAMPLTRAGNTLKVITILLGAVTAAKGTFDKVYGTTDNVSLVVFSLIGLVIAVSAGIEAAFKFDKRGAELTLLASSCQAKSRAFDTEWRTHIGSNPGTDQRDAARRLIKSADDQLAKAQEAAAKLGVNITLQVYTLRGPEYRQKVSA